MDPCLSSDADEGTCGCGTSDPPSLAAFGAVAAANAHHEGRRPRSLARSRRNRCGLPGQISSKSPNRSSSAGVGSGRPPRNSFPGAPGYGGSRCIAPSSLGGILPGQVLSPSPAPQPRRISVRKAPAQSTDENYCWNDVAYVTATVSAPVAGAIGGQRESEQGFPRQTKRRPTAHVEPPLPRWECAWHEEDFPAASVASEAALKRSVEAPLKLTAQGCLSPLVAWSPGSVAGARAATKAAASVVTGGGGAEARDDFFPTSRSSSSALPPPPPYATGPVNEAPALLLLGSASSSPPQLEEQQFCRGRHSGRVGSRGGGVNAECRPAQVITPEEVDRLIARCMTQERPAALVQASAALLDAGAAKLNAEVPESGEKRSDKIRRMLRLTDELRRYNASLTECS
eukprot:TRINITY_DN23690_c0_g1_i1.p1 TRINITY_DN23690_c0_g1~~TRINITY_DN23690_c0_g1_i1.p1  ORF type:complete len:448 (+),score=44.16 TRINITY_DN23690_c0_g1_i1:147-1346(+)